MPARQSRWGFRFATHLDKQGVQPVLVFVFTARKTSAGFRARALVCGSGWWHCVRTECPRCNPFPKFERLRQARVVPERKTLLRCPLVPYLAAVPSLTSLCDLTLSDAVSDAAATGRGMCGRSGKCSACAVIGGADDEDLLSEGIGGAPYVKIYSSVMLPQLAGGQAGGCPERAGEGLRRGGTRFQAIGKLDFSGGLSRDR